MFEPELTGISYSFTDDGHYEEAYYRAISNRKHTMEPSIELRCLLFNQLPSRNVRKVSCNGNTENTQRTQMDRYL